MSEVKAHVTLSGAVLLTGSIPRRCYVSILPLPNVGQQYHVRPVYSWAEAFSPMRAQALGATRLDVVPTTDEAGRWILPQYLTLPEDELR